MSADEVERLRVANAELRRLLEKHQWSGMTPFASVGACPECNGPATRGHRPQCALAAALLQAVDER